VINATATCLGWPHARGRENLVHPEGGAADDLRNCLLGCRSQRATGAGRRSSGETSGGGSSVDSSYNSDDVEQAVIDA
jgi:hypothetical protein